MHMHMGMHIFIIMLLQNCFMLLSPFLGSLMWA